MPRDSFKQQLLIYLLYFLSPHLTYGDFLSRSTPLADLMEKHRRDDSPSGLSDIAEGDGLLGTGLTVRTLLVFFRRVTVASMLLICYLCT